MNRFQRLRQKFRLSLSVDLVNIILFISALFVLAIIFYSNRQGKFEKHLSGVYSVDVNSENLIVSASENELLFWKERECIARIAYHKDAIKTVRFSNSGKYLASGSIDKTVKVWSASEKSVLKELTNHSNGVNTVAFDQTDQLLISAGYDDRLIIWDWRNSKILKEFSIKHTEISINENNDLVFVDSLSELRILNLNTLALKKRLTYEGAPKFLPSNNFIALDTGRGHVQIIDILSEKIVSEINTNPNNHITEISSFELLSDTEIIVAKWGGVLELWNLQAGKLVKTFGGHPVNSINDLAINWKTKELISASGDGSIKTWDLRTGDSRLALGDGEFKRDLIRTLLVLLLLSLTSSFLALKFSTKNFASSIVIIIILSIWTFGIFLILLKTEKAVHTISKPLIWILTSLTGLFLLSFYGAFLALFSIPLALSLHYLQLKNPIKVKSIDLSIVNILFCWFLAGMFLL